MTSLLDLALGQLNKEVSIVKTRGRSIYRMSQAKYLFRVLGQKHCGERPLGKWRKALGRLKMSENKVRRKTFGLKEDRKGGKSGKLHNK